MKNIFALSFATLIACGGNIDTVIDHDASGNPIGDAGADVLSPDAQIQGVSRNGWTWNNVGPQAADLYAIWASSPNDVWFVGAAGVILHFDGTNFSAPQSPSGKELRGIWGSAANDVWAVSSPYWDASDAEILHYDGATWSIVQTIPSVSLTAVWGSTSNDVWAVGTKGFATHWDGQTWTTIASPTPNDLTGVWVASDHTAWAVGTGEAYVNESTIVQWNGSAWSTTPSPDNSRGSYAHVWGTSTSDVWLVGAAQIDKTQPGLDPSGYLIHWNGGGWDSPFVVSDFQTPLRAIHGVSGSSVFSAGSASAAESWTGSVWSSANLPGDFETVWENSPSDVWAAGLGGVMAHFDGTSWTELTPPPPEYGVYSAASVWVNSADDAWIVGNGAESAEILHWDGQTWNASSIPETSPAWIYFFGLWGTSATNMWGVGSGPGQQTARIVHFDGTAWTTIYDLPKAYDFLSAWGANENDVWFSGGNGALMHWNGTAMMPMSQNTQDSLYAVRGNSSTDVWLAGNTNTDLTMRHWNGSAWTVAYTGPGVISSLYVSGSDVWGVGWEGSAIHFDGQSWTSPTLPREVGAIWGSAPNDLWAVGYFGAVLHYDGAAWSFVPITEASFAGIGGSSALDVWMVTSAGAILHHP